MRKEGWCATKATKNETQALFAIQDFGQCPVSEKQEELSANATFFK